MEAVTRSEHERKELIICILQHSRNLEDLGGIAKLMGFTQDGINFIEEVRTQEAAPGRESVKYKWNNQSSKDNMQLFNTKSLRLQLFEEVHVLAAKRQRFIDMLIKFEIGIEENTKQLESINTFYMGLRIW